MTSIIERNWYETRQTSKERNKDARIYFGRCSFVSVIHNHESRNRKVASQVSCVLCAVNAKKVNKNIQQRTLSFVFVFYFPLFSWPFSGSAINYEEWTTVSSINIDYYMLRAWYRFYSRVFNSISRTSESSSKKSSHEVEVQESCN